MGRAENNRGAARLAYAARSGRAFASDPYEAYERVLEKIAGWRDHRAGPVPYLVQDGAEQPFHELIGASWPCVEDEGFDVVWTSMLGELTARGVTVGRGAFGGWDDGDGRLVHLAWCLTRHSRPKRILETGVARGLTTRVLLEALELNHDGHLWSIDLAPLLEDDLATETAIAVPSRLHGRWTFVRGSSRRVLPGLVAGLGQIDLFIHDSMHTTRNVRFELERVWPAVSPGGVLLLDDVERNAGMRDFLATHPGAGSLICTAEDGTALIGCIFKPSSGA